jgi:phage I-like protein
MMSETPRFVIALAAMAADAAGLVRIPLAKVITAWKGKQKFSITRKDMAAIVANFRKQKTDVVIDYDHSTEFAAGGGQPAPASGWLKAIEDGPDDNGILWGQAEFTPAATAMLANKEYKYISPVINWGTRDKSTGEQQGATITSIALTNSPVLEDLPAIALSEAGWKEIDRGDAGDEHKEVRVVKVILADRVARTVRLVAEDGAESTVTVEGLEAPPKVLRLSDVKRGAEGQYDFASLDAGGDVLVAGEVFRAQQVQTEVNAAIAKGVITPAQRPFYEKMALSDLEGFRGLVATMKPVVDFTEHGTGGSGDEATELQKVEAMLNTKVAEKVKGDPKLQYHEALKLVASENPDLDRRRTTLIREGGNR